MFILHHQIKAPFISITNRNFNRKSVHNHHAEISLCVNEIRRLAATYQSGNVLSEVKRQVDEAIHNLAGTLGRNRTCRLAVWSQMNVDLQSYISNLSDPRWLDVINHARHRVKTRRYTVKTGMNSRRDVFSNDN